MIATKTMIPRAVISVVIAHRPHPAVRPGLLRLGVPRARGVEDPRHLLEEDLKHRHDRHRRAARQREPAGEGRRGRRRRGGTKPRPSPRRFPPTSRRPSAGLRLDRPVAPPAPRSGPTLDSRHVILGGSLLSAAVFGFPVFCLICPIGLTFATIVLVMRLFAFGDVAWGVILVPALLARRGGVLPQVVQQLLPHQRPHEPHRQGEPHLRAHQVERCEVPRDRAGRLLRGMRRRVPPGHQRAASRGRHELQRNAPSAAPAWRPAPHSAITMPFLPKKVQGAFHRRRGGRRDRAGSLAVRERSPCAVFPRQPAACGRLTGKDTRLWPERKRGRP